MTDSTAGVFSRAQMSAPEFSVRLERPLISIYLPREPQAWERVNWNGKRAFDPPANVRGKKRIRAAIDALYPGRFPAEQLWRERVGIALIFETQLWDTDADNYAKLVLDALKGHVLKDDRIVDEIYARVNRGAKDPNTQLVVYEMNTRLEV